MGFFPNLSPLISQLLFFLSFLFSLSSSSSATQLCSHKHTAALLKFKSSFSINKSASNWCEYTYPKTESWKEGTDCCSWDGITCDNVTGNVLDLDLSCSGLYGSFPSNSSLFLIKSLQSLNLSYNDFKLSKIAREIGQFVSLTHLDLSSSSFSGQVPNEISHLSKLVSLDLSNEKMGISILANGVADSNSQLKLETTTFKSIVQNLTKVRELSLAGFNMSYVDPRYLLNLSSSLTYLQLWNSNFRGKFPEDVFRFPNLEFLVLSGSEQLTINFPSSNWSSPLQVLNMEDLNIQSGLCVEGLPDSIGELKSLKVLFLICCHLEGSIPASIGNLTQLDRLVLSYNKISGMIPPSVTNLTQLSHLSLLYNQLSGPIPVRASGLSKLKSLVLGNNFLEGTIPSWIFTLPSLELLSLHDNQLQGQINQFQQKSLEVLFLDNNKLQGPIPSSISNFVNLTALDLSSNNLSGNLELDMFSQLQKLELLSLSNNSLSLRNNINVNYTLPKLQTLLMSSCNLSEFPKFLRGSKDLQELDLSKNRIEGVLPILPIHTTFFSVSNNYLTGGIPFELCKAKFLNILDLSHNNLSGMIPECLVKLSKSLSVLNLQANSFYGHMPSTFPEGCGIKSLNFHGNQMEGLLRKSLLNCSMLEVLDISNNNIKDTFPYWLESLPKLQVLILRSNKFHGFVHNTKANSSFPKLRVLDLSNNDFVGPLPMHYIENLKAMVNPHEDDNSSQYMGGRFSYEYSATLTLKGFIIKLEKVLTICTSFDLSKNKFVGEIPKVIGKLSSLKGLNLSHNNLNGHIPHSLGNLTNLEWLDLSSNELVGEIPQELVSLTSLSILDLSNNQLVGCIPQGNQFNTFGNSSYEGNPGLYGFPLTKSCDGNGTPQQPQGSIRGKDLELLEFGWRVVLLGYGCGLVLGLLMGYLAFQTRKPKWFVNLFDGLQNRRVRKVKKALVRAQKETNCRFGHYDVTVC